MSTRSMIARRLVIQLDGSEPPDWTAAECGPMLEV